jgi:putative ABC transport system permease protein
MRPARGSSGAIALGLLVCAAVFAAIAGPAASLHLRTQALRQTEDGIGGTAKTVQGSATLSDFLTAIASGGNDFGSGPIGQLTPALLEQSRLQLRRSLGKIPLPLAAGDWAGLVTKDTELDSGYAPSAVAQAPPQATLIYRDTLTSNAGLIAGSFTPSRLPAGTIPVTASPATAARFGVHPGSRLVMGGVRLLVTGILRIPDQASDFWQTDSTVLAPQEQTEQYPYKGEHFWLGEFAVDPDALGTMRLLPTATLRLQWQFPLALSGFNADQVSTLAGRLSAASSGLPQMSGAMEFAADDISISTPLLQPLQGFLAVQTAVLAVLLLLFVSLAVTAAAVIVLAGRMIVDRRTEELTMLRARGASSRQVGVLLGRSSALAAIPAAAAGAALALAVVPGAGTASGGPGGGILPASSAVLGWALACLTLLLALACAPVIGTWRHRRPAPAANPARVTSGGVAAQVHGGLRRLVAELTACGAAAACLVLLHGQGVPSAGRTNWFLTVAPVLAAIPAVIVILRLYPLVIRLLLRLAGRRAGATGYIALASSARTSLATVAPAFALVLALTVAAFAGMVSNAINGGQILSSWQATGADAVVNSAQLQVPITPAAQRALAAVPGVQHEAAVWNTSWTTANGQELSVSAVDPAQYATLTAATPFPALPAGELTGSPASVTTRTVINVLASPQAAAALGTGTTTLSSSLDMGPVTVHVAGPLSGTPAQVSSSMFVVMPLRTLPGSLGRPDLNVALLTGAGIDRARLDATVAKLLPGSSVAYRMDTLAGLRSSPLQHGAQQMMLLTVVATAVFGLLNLVLGLALGAADRDLTSARLAVMGHEQAGRLALAETLPAVLAAAAGGLACALALPPLVSNALDLSVFTDSSAPVAMRPGLVTLGLPAAAMLLLAIVALAVQTRLARHRGTTGLLRVS